MKRSIIPLGGGCDAATTLKKTGLRKDQMPFDWLWNLDRGLFDVADIISSRFAHVRNREDYVYGDHATWPDTEMLVFRTYPRIAHIHSNPLEDAATLEDYNLRIDRFLESIDDCSAKAIFIYYRNASPEPDLDTGNDMAKLEKLRDESGSFVDMMLRRFPDKPFSLISLLALPRTAYADRSRMRALASSCKNIGSERVSYDLVPMRDDSQPDEFPNWIKAWQQAYKRAGVYSSWDVLLAKVAKRLK